MVLTLSFTGLASDPLAESPADGTQDFPALVPWATMTAGIQAGILQGTTVITTTMASLEDSVTTGLLEPHVARTVRTETLSTADRTVGAGGSDPERGRVTTGPRSGCPTNRSGRPSMEERQSVTEWARCSNPTSRTLPTTPWSTASFPIGSAGMTTCS